MIFIRDWNTYLETMTLTILRDIISFNVAVLIPLSTYSIINNFQLAIRLFRHHRYFIYNFRHITPQRSIIRETKIWTRIARCFKYTKNVQRLLSIWNTSINYVGTNRGGKRTRSCTLIAKIGHNNILLNLINM